MVDCSDSARQNHKDSAEEIADPHTQPDLPPGQTQLDSGGCDFPRVDVERVGDPEGHKVPPSPSLAGLLDGFQILVVEKGVDLALLGGDLDPLKEAGRSRVVIEIPLIKAHFLVVN